MAGVPPRPEQTTLQIVVQGVQKEVKALHNPDGSFMTDANGYVYEASDGKRVTLRFMAGNRENDPPPAQPPTPSPACDGDVDSDGALAAFPAAAASAEDVEELWSARKTRFFIAKYSEMKDLVGKTRALRQWKGEVKEGLPVTGVALFVADWTPEEKTHLGEELSDVLVYLVRLADRCQVDLPAAVLRKVELNRQKYPASKVYGKSDKYTAYSNADS
ncbi:hypothetical protein HPB51_021377 [Rhipicephalus microplus]|uniref:dCTP pyrophosphatase 1 n=1 Tax=Rhipicephalus microplus TaxID=6941 RepID=A0A9J6F8W2_RHIMP|nr:hypothetical protein HPB51_021377 [Rhipicephalus microplus]